ncbi:class F sortase [Curtobacterium sp. 1544]|uniref:class F sortase n=1 Tax=Curtobacterium sp. 1544 TaxID=3156417 RepID=UPI003390F86C
MTDTTHEGGRRRRWIFLIVGVATALALVMSVLGYITTHSGPVDLNGNRVQAEDVPTAAASASAVADSGGQFVVKSVGLDVPLGALNAVGGTVEPTGFTSAYWIRNEGVSTKDPAKGTVFVVMHSLRNGGVGPGNYLIDVKDQKSKVGLGTTIQVDGVTYKVTGAQAVKKTDLSRSATIWADTPNRLVVITCLQRPQGGPSVDNMVIQAVRT